MNFLQPCLNCESTHVTFQSEERNKLILYFYKCQSCGNESSKTMILDAAQGIWNVENVGDVKETLITDEIKEIETQIKYIIREIKNLEDEIFDKESELLELKNKLNTLNDNLLEIKKYSQILKFIY